MHVESEFWHSRRTRLHRVSKRARLQDELACGLVYSRVVCYQRTLQVQDEPIARRRERAARDFDASACLRAQHFDFRCRKDAPETAFPVRRREFIRVQFSPSTLFVAQDGLYVVRGEFQFFAIFEGRDRRKLCGTGSTPFYCSTNFFRPASIIPQFFSESARSFSVALLFWASETWV